jgi:uncharacterized protein YndB with AHSA1/START domain
MNTMATITESVIKLQVTRLFDAPREQVFQAWTDPNQFQQWFSRAACEGAAVQSVKIDARVGGKYRIQTRRPDGEYFTTVGVYREVKPPERLVFTWQFEKDGSGTEFGEVEPPEMLVTITFRARGEQTELTLTHEKFASQESRDRHNQGWGRCLDALETFVETKSAPSNAAADPSAPLIVRRTFNLPAARIWKAITDIDEMRRWYFDVENFKPEIGCEFRFVVQHEGNTYDHRCKVTEVIPQKKIAYTWRYHGHEGTSLVAFELIANDQRTKLKLTHAGLENFPAVPMFARGNFQRGWTSLIGESLPDYVENLDREIYLSQEFDAPRELVWEAMVNPRHVVNWWGPRGFSLTIEKMDFRVGGEWQHVMRGPDGVNYPNHSVFQEIVKLEKIVFAHGGQREGGSGVSFVSTWSFEKLAADKTRVSIRMVFPSAAERARVVKEFGAVEGGRQTLERLGEYLPRLRSA